MIHFDVADLRHKPVLTLADDRVLRFEIAMNNAAFMGGTERTWVKT